MKSEIIEPVKEQKTHRIAILSDTHSLLRLEVREVLQSCEVIIHGGDIASRKTFEEIRAIAPAYFVRGNADEEWIAAILDGGDAIGEADKTQAGGADDIAEQLPIERDIELYGFHFYMTHKKKDIRQDLSRVDVVIYGHSHKYTENKEGETLYLNPGSCGPRRFTQPITMAVMTIDEERHSYVIERINCKPENTGQMNANAGDRKCAEDQGVLPGSVNSVKDMDRLIRAIIKDMRSNRPVDKIAARNKVSVDFVNQILQIYTTHPGIDVDGILNRMDILGK